MNVYDFDNTVYDGESIVDFYFFLLKKDFRLIKLLPKVMNVLIKYKRCMISEKELISEAEKYARLMFQNIKDLDSLVIEFWDKNMHKIKAFYLRQKKDDDVILSANASFLLEEITRRLEVKMLICSKVDVKTGKISRLCFGKNKIKCFFDAFPEGEIESFYTDSLNDSPMFAFAKKSYIVSGEKIKEYKK